MVYCLDTHCLVWFLLGKRNLGSTAKRILQDRSFLHTVPTIVLVESIRALRRLGVLRSPLVLVAQLRQQLNYLPIPFDEATFLDLPATLEEHDAMIVSCALAAGRLFDDDVTLLTCDEEIVASGLIRTAW